MSKVILHIDLNAFYATVAAINEPYLKDKVFVVGGSSISNRGMILTASYKARSYGIKAAMSVNEAMDLYPNVLIVPTAFDQYRKYSKLFFEILRRYSTKLLRGSIDEGYLDVTHLTDKKTPYEIAKEIQDLLNIEYNLPVSIGIAPTLFLAKMASDLQKPLGITEVNKSNIKDKILPLPIKDLYGVGRKTYPELIKLGINTIGDFINLDNKSKVLTLMTEDNYVSICNNINGNSSNIVEPNKYAIPSTISKETTFNYFIDNTDIILAEIKDLLVIVHKRLIAQDLITKTVTIKIRDSKFHTITRSMTINYTDDYNEIEAAAESLFLENYKEQTLRLVGVGVTSIIEKRFYRQEYNLFNYLYDDKSKDVNK